MTDRSERGNRIAFLLSQLGTVASQSFEQRVREFGLSAADAGILRIVSGSEALNQSVLAGRLGVLPSRLVVLIDSLEERGLIERVRSTTDRRNYEVRLTKDGTEMMVTLRRAARDHEAALTEGLSDTERNDLRVILEKLLELNGVDADAHVGYRRRPH